MTVRRKKRIRGVPFEKHDRRTTIGASEVAAICGFSPWSDPLKVFLQKKDRLPPTAVSDVMRWGQVVETSLLDWYAEVTGVHVDRPIGTIVFVPQMGRVLGYSVSPDGIVYGHRTWTTPLHGVEAKNVNGNRGHLWGEPGTSDVPPDIAAQCQWSMFGTGLDRWDVVVSIAGRPPLVYHLERDEQSIDLMVTEVEKFNKLLVDDIHPVVTTAEATSVNALFQKSTGSIRPIADLDAVVVGQWRAARGELEAFEPVVEELANKVRYLIGDDDGVSGTFGRVTNKPSKGRTTIDWNGIVATLQRMHPVDPKVLDGIIGDHTTTGAPSRRLVPNFLEGI